MDDTTEKIYNQTKQLAGTVIQYKELLMIYTCAIKEVQTKFDVLNTEFKVRYQMNPISAIHTRLKSTASIADKLERQGIPFSLENIRENILDVAGIRVICFYIDDIYRIADALLSQDDIRLVHKKDYIKNPKPNGYRSLHLIVNVPVFFAEEKKNVNVEVQVRTIAMDFWASLEHQLKYKKNIPKQEEIIQQLKACADSINTTDWQMLYIRHQIESATDTPSEDEVLLKKLSQLDIQIG